jgi:glutamyl-tRNA synthetase
MKVVTRYAPSPTGPQHIGGVRTALYCYLFARKHQGEFILRIEDTDQTRFVPGAEQYIIDAVNWCGFKFTQGVHIGGPHAPYRQSERSEIYRKHAQTLLDGGFAYIAFDTPEEIEEMKRQLEATGVKGATYNYMTRTSMRNSLTMSAEEVQQRIAAGEKYVVRFKIPAKEEIRFHDIVREHVNIHSSQLDDKVLLKSDGLPTYHLANVVDDHLMAVTHVIRGDEWLSSTPLHILLYRAFGWEDTMPTFAHLPLMINPDGSKMSKRNAAKFGIPVFPQNWTVHEDGPEAKKGDIWEGYRNLGYLPEAFLNYIALLGWHPSSDQEIMSLDELTAAFSLEGVNKAPVKFDIEKLKFFNAHYLRQKPNSELLPEVKSQLSALALPHPTDEALNAIVNQMRERVTFAREFVQNCLYYYAAPVLYDEEVVKKKWKEESDGLLKAFAETAASVEVWTATNLEQAAKDMTTAMGAKLGSLMMPLRTALTGVTGGPGTFDIAEVIGKEESLRRLQAAIAMIAAERANPSAALLPADYQKYAVKVGAWRTADGRILLTLSANRPEKLEQEKWDQEVAAIKKALGLQGEWVE